MCRHRVISCAGTQYSQGQGRRQQRHFSGTQTSNKSPLLIAFSVCHRIVTELSFWVYNSLKMSGLDVNPSKTSATKVEHKELSFIYSKEVEKFLSQLTIMHKRPPKILSLHSCLWFLIHFYNSQPSTVLLKRTENRICGNFTSWRPTGEDYFILLPSARHMFTFTSQSLWMKLKNKDKY